MNTCPVYRRSTGHSYTYFIPGPIGVNLGMVHDPKAYADNLSACSLCLSCDKVCPVHVDPGSQIYTWRQRLEPLGKVNATKQRMSQGMKLLFTHPTLYRAALRLAPLANCVPESIVPRSLNPWGEGHAQPHFAKESFHEMWRKGKVKK